MTAAERTQMIALVNRWRKQVAYLLRHNEDVGADIWDACADELDALLRTFGTDIIDAVARQKI